LTDDIAGREPHINSVHKPTLKRKIPNAYNTEKGESDGNYKEDNGEPWLEKIAQRRSERNPDLHKNHSISRGWIP
jgi:hypothetical protein